MPKTETLPPSGLLRRGPSLIQPEPRRPKQVGQKNVDTIARKASVMVREREIRARAGTGFPQDSGFDAGDTGSSETSRASTPDLKATLQPALTTPGFNPATQTRRKLVRRPVVLNQPGVSVSSPPTSADLRHAIEDFYAARAARKAAQKKLKIITWGVGIAVGLGAAIGLGVAAGPAAAIFAGPIIGAAAAGLAYFLGKRYLSAGPSKEDIEEKEGTAKALLKRLYPDAESNPDSVLADTELQDVSRSFLQHLEYIETPKSRKQAADEKMEHYQPSATPGEKQETKYDNKGM